DENDGLFDHVPPPTPLRGTPGEFIDRLPIGAGFRVPCIIISPWTAGGYVCSDLSDHTSVLKFLERFTGVAATTISSWRRNLVGDLTGAFRKVSEAPPPVLPDTSGPLTLADYTSTLPLPPFPGAA